MTFRQECHIPCRSHSRWFPLLPLALLLTASAARAQNALPAPPKRPAPLPTLPSGQQVVSGNVAFSKPDSSTLNITQTSQNAIVNWQAFSIGKDGRVRFFQPSDNAVILNRVLGSDPSQIFGVLTANGKVFLINPRGILFGKDSSVNVGTLVASTLDIKDEDFRRGHYRFAANGSLPSSRILPARGPHQRDRLSLSMPEETR